MNSKHTPGPWVVSDSEHEGIADDDYHFVRAGDGIYNHPDYTGFEISGLMNIHEAKLMAAAPELLAELQNIANANPSSWDEETRDQFQQWAQNRARAAIAKATGEQS